MRTKTVQKLSKNGQMKGRSRVTLHPPQYATESVY